MKHIFFQLMLMTVSSTLWAEEHIDIWPDLAPGETTRLIGEAAPFRQEEVPHGTRVSNITKPTFTAHLADQPNGAGVIILPGGGFGKVVVDKEGTEAAAWLNQQGVAAFVLSYRTKTSEQDPGWQRPLQDAQRAMALIRSQAEKWKLKPERIGILGFSAGGQVAARLLSDQNKLSYDPVDAVDKVSHRPDFALLIYPWNMYDPSRSDLIEGIRVTKNCPPTFIVHTDDDVSSSLGSTMFYTGLKRHGIPAELHVYGNGGHGYGLRAIKGSEIATWTEHAKHWLNR